MFGTYESSGTGEQGERVGDKDRGWVRSRSCKILTLVRTLSLFRVRRRALNDVILFFNWGKIHIRLIILTVLKYTIQYLLVLSEYCVAITTVGFQNIFITPRRNPVPIKQSLPISVTTNLLSVSMDLPILDISYKWNHTECGHLCLAFHFSIIFSRFIHVVACIELHSFLLSIIFHYMAVPHFLYLFIC